MKLLPSSSIGKKILMAITGQVMIIFIIFHVIGNSTIYINRINAYAEQLHSLPLLLWGYRGVMVVLFLFHVVIGIKVYLENRTANPKQYAVQKSLSTTVAGKTMIWTGLVIGIFLIYHLLHFTVQVTHPEISAKMNMDSLGRPDVFTMVVLSFQKVFIAIVYVIAMIALALHLTHGIESSFQTLGLNNDRAQPVMTKAGSLAALILFIGYVSIPIVIVMGLLTD
jgi:succinate dehydrogenase / fumarate reductase cytochrome b subunit